MLGKPIQINPARIYNCAYTPIDHPDVFSETMFLLLGGTGVGFSVQKQHVAKLPILLGPKNSKRRYVVGDSIEGWADAIKVLIEAYFFGKPSPTFDFSDIRPKGALLITTGGKAPGPQPLNDCIHNLRKVLDNAIISRGSGTRLTTLECHDIMCFIADAVLAGGIRRAALISLFSHDDESMLTCKYGEWWELNPQRGRANNSATLPRNTFTKAEFDLLWGKIVASGSGEPGVYFSNDLDLGTNPCCEISLNPNQFCNLVETNVGDVISQEDLNARVKAAAFIGTLQAGYTDFHYLRPIWKETTEREALLGVGLTGIGSGVVLNLNLEEAAQQVLLENERVAKIIGINKAARSTTVKPAGTSSLTIGCSSGVHAWHNEYYIRRIRVSKNEAIYNYMFAYHPELVADEFFRPTEQAVIEIPQKAPDNAILRHEASHDLLERVKKINVEWVHPGHNYGANTHNVSCTISVKPDEWASVGEWMWENRDYYNGISVLPYDGGSYIQAPFEDISKEQYENLVKHLHEVDLTKIIEIEDNTDLAGEVACGSNGCELK